MHPLSTDDLRQKYLQFFEGHGHAVIPSASLLPENDPTVLFTTAGMHPLVPYLLGESHPSGKRLVSVQRCVRTQDIDEVGDASHLTMFEMLGNWSLGDYFKKGAIAMSFEFLTEILGIPLPKLAVTCFEGDRDAPKDTESAKIWTSMGIPKERIGFLPKAKNWWGPAGQTGPCGPDTEMFYWIGKGDLPPKGSNPANDESNWLEIWNDVFMQYNKTSEGTFDPLTQQNVDTGMGLERVAQVLQGVTSVYETDRMRPIMECVLSFTQTTNQKPVTSTLRAARIIVDHIRAATFIIADGVRPSNVDRGYVLRKLIRRAIRSGRTLGITDHFTAGIADAVLKEYGHFYAFLPQREHDVRSVLTQEEVQFRRTLEEGLKHFKRETEKLTGKRIEGTTAFHLYDTYGFPLELTREMAAEQGLTVDESGFRSAFTEHQEKSRSGAGKKFKGGLADHSAETTKLHTATHLLNAALCKVLGTHVQQKGSNITAERLRFDFNHPDKMKPEQIKEVETLVNDAIRADLPVAYHITTVEGAKKENAIGVFDERYGSEVKVYVVGDAAKGAVFSKEICGGPHVARTGMIGNFSIQKEESSAAGIRRIKAIVSGGPTEISMAGETM